MNSGGTELLNDLRHAIVRALSSSEEVRGLFDKVRSEGYSLFFVVNRNGEPEPTIGEGVSTTGTSPVFRIDAQDLEILKGLGIDPTRSTRRRQRPGM